MSLANLVTQYIVQYGFRIMGAALVLIAALFVAKSVGTLFERWLHQQEDKDGDGQGAAGNEGAFYDPGAAQPGCQHITHR